MPDKKHNNPPDWRERLEGPDQVPGLATLNKGEAWEKLYIRLEQPEKKNKKAWLWMSAAAILTGLLITITWFYLEQNEKEQLVVQQQPASETLKIQEPAASREVQTKITQPVKARPQQKDMVNMAHPRTVNTSEPAVALNEKEVSPVIFSVRLIQQPNMVTENRIDSSIIPLVPVINTKKKMAVVYLNEIEAGNSGFLITQPGTRKRRPLYPKFGQPGGENVYVASQPERFTITLSSAN